MSSIVNIGNVMYKAITYGRQTKLYGVLDKRANVKTLRNFILTGKNTTSLEF